MVFWAVTPYNPVSGFQGFEGTYRLHLQGYLLETKEYNKGKKEGKGKGEEKKEIIPHRISTSSLTSSVHSKLP
jgi:hypothetical protein